MNTIIDFILSRKVIVPLLIILTSIVTYLFLSKLIKKLLSIKLKGVRINDRRQKTTMSLIDNVLKYFILYSSTSYDFRCLWY